MSYPEAVPYVPETDSFQIRATIDTVKQSLVAHKWLVLVMMLVTTGLVTLYVYIWPPTFQAEVIVAADSDKDQQRNAFYQGWNIFRKDTLTDEATLMTSPPVLKEVIQRLDLRYADVYHPFSSYMVHLWMESAVGKFYRKIKLSLFPQPKSPFTLSEKEMEQGKVLKDFKESVSMQQVGEASIGLLVVKGSNQRVAEIANTVVQVYLEQRRKRFVREAEDAYTSLNEETNKALAEVRGVEAEMKQFYSDNGMFLTFEKERVQIGQLLELRTQVTNYEAQIADSESAIRIIDTQLGNESRQLTADKVFQVNAARDRLTRLEIALAEAKQAFQPGSPEVLQIETQIRAAKSDLAGHDPGKTIVRNMQSISESYEVLQRRRWELESKLQGDRAALKIKREEYDRMQTLLGHVPEQMQLNHDLERRQVAYESKYRSLNEKLTMAAVSMATAKSAPASMRVIEFASPPEKASWPNTKLLIAAGALLGLLAGVIGALLQDLMFMRANRHRLTTGTTDYRMFATVGQDEAFLDSLFLKQSPAT